MRHSIYLIILLFFGCKNDDDCFECFIASLDANNELQINIQEFCGTEDDFEEWELDQLIIENNTTLRFGTCNQEFIPCVEIIEFSNGSIGIAPRFISFDEDVEQTEQEFGYTCQR